MVERLAVNEHVPGSSPGLGAIIDAQTNLKVVSSFGSLTPRFRFGGEAFLSRNGSLVMKIIAQKIILAELDQMAAAGFGNMVKAVVDIDKELLAVDAELHSDLEALLLENGSKQKSLWGINFYPEMKGDDFVEFDSMINMRPSQGNRSRGVDSPGIRKKIMEIVSQKVAR